MSGQWFKHLRTFGDSGELRFAHWHSKGNYIIAGSKDTLVWMWNVDNEEVTICSGHGDEVTCGNFTPDGKRIVTGSADETIKVWNPKSGECIRTLKKVGGVKFHESPILSLEIVGKSVISGDESGNVYISQYQTGETIGPMVIHTSTVESIALRDHLAATGGLEGIINVIDIGKLETKIQLKLIEEGEGVT